MDKGKEEQIKRVFKRILNNFKKEVKHNWSPEIEDIITNATAGEMLKEVTIRTYVP